MGGNADIAIAHEIDVQPASLCLIGAPERRLSASTHAEFATPAISMLEWPARRFNICEV